MGFDLVHVYVGRGLILHAFLTREGSLPSLFEAHNEYVDSTHGAHGVHVP